jgi:uncharacterized membrane protein YjgN (DUF898 family)
MRARRWLRIGAAAFTGIIALSAYAGVIGFVGGAISFGETINARLPYQSLFLAGMALLLVVVAPMTAAAVACIRDLRYARELVIGAGLLLVAWIGIELAIIRSYSWFHPAYLLLAILVMISGCLLERGDRTNLQSTTTRQVEPRLRSQLSLTSVIARLSGVFLGFPPLARLLGGSWPITLGWALALCAVPIVIIVDASDKALRRSGSRELAPASVGTTNGGRR